MAQTSAPANKSGIGQNPAAEIEYFNEDVGSAVQHCAELIVHVDPVMQAMMDYARPAKNDRIVDVGTGLGWMPVKLAMLGYSNIIGVDLSPTRIEAARQLAERMGQKVDFRATTTESIGTGECDLALSMCFLHHFSDFTAPLRDIRRILRPGGRLFIYEPNAFWPFAGYKMDFRLNVTPGYGTENETLFGIRSLQRQLERHSFRVDFLSTNWYSKRLTRFVGKLPLKHLGRSIVAVASAV